MADVFVSYSRKDGAFVHELYDVLAAAGRDVWVDWEDIPPASQWEQDDLRLDRRGRERRLRRQPELARVEVLRRRAAARRRRRQARRADRDRRRRSRSRRRWRSGSSTGSGRATTDDRAAAFAALERALDTDLEWSRAHTRLLVRAVEWDERKDASLLLRGRDLEEAERELAANAGNDPRPTELQQRYLHASRRAASRRQRALLGGVTAALARLDRARRRRAPAAQHGERPGARRGVEDARAAVGRRARDRRRRRARPRDRGRTRRARLPKRESRCAGRSSRTRSCGRRRAPRPVRRAPSTQSLAFSPDGRLAARRDAGREAEPVGRGRRRARARPHAGRAAALGPGGRVLSARGRVLRLLVGGRPVTRVA